MKSDTDRINQLEARNLELAQMILQLTTEIQQKNGLVGELETQIDDLKREKWSVQSELDMLWTRRFPTIPAQYN